jgi:hypothetical protein
VSFVAPSFTLSPASSTLSFTSGAASGNTDVVTVSSINGFNGTVTVGCTISTGAAYYQPTCSTGAGTASVSPGVNGSVTVTIGSTTAVTMARAGAVQAGLGGTGWRFGLAALLALMLGLLPRRGRRNRPVWLALLLAAGLLPLAGCGSGTSPAKVTHSSAGTYTVTVTGTGLTTGSSTATTSSTTFTVTIN